MEEALSSPSVLCGAPESWNKGCKATLTYYLDPCRPCMQHYILKFQFVLSFKFLVKYFISFFKDGSKNKDISREKISAIIALKISSRMGRKIIWMVTRDWFTKFFARQKTDVVKEIAKITIELGQTTSTLLYRRIKNDNLIKNKMFVKLKITAKIINMYAYFTVQFSDESSIQMTTDDHQFVLRRVGQRSKVGGTIKTTKCPHQSGRGKKLASKIRIPSSLWRIPEMRNCIQRS